MLNTQWSWAWDWWSALVVINVVNLVVCGVLFSRSRNSIDLEYAGYRKLMRNEFADYIQDEKTQLRKEQLDSTKIAPPL